jgi:hypothetical protein
MLQVNFCSVNVGDMKFIVVSIIIENRYRVFIIVTRCGLWSGVRSPAGTRDFSLLQNVLAGSGAHPASYSLGTAVLCWG